MKAFKKMIKVIFGQATPFQLFLGCLFGFILGFIPGFAYAPFLSVLFIFLVLIFNVNIGFVVITWLIGKVLSFIIEGISFHVGVWLLDGFTSPLFKWMVNTPVLAYAGFDYYLVAGGFVVSIILGVIVGFIIVKLFTSVRNKMASVQTDQAIYQKIVNKLWVKILTWVLIGKPAHKIDWFALKNKKLKHPFRISGVVFVIVLVVLLFVFQSFLQNQMVSNILKTQLTKLNGATVDFNALEINLSDAKLSVQGLGFTDPKNLTKDRFYAADLTAKLNITHLLTKRLSLNQVTINDISFDHTRNVKGTLYQKDNTSKGQANVVTESNQASSNDQMKSYPIDQYVKNINQYKSYLNDINRVLNMLGGSQSEESDKNQSKSAAKQAQVYGYIDVRADHLINKVPTLTIENLTANNIKTNFDNKIFDLQGVNLATEPYLLDKSSVINLASKDQSITVKLMTANQTNKPNTVNINLNKLPAEALLNNIKFNEGFSLNAQTMSLDTNGQWMMTSDQMEVDLPVNLTLYDVDLNVSNINKKMNSLPLQFKISGNLNNPNFNINNDQIKNILLQAGASAIQEKVGEQLKGKLPSGLPF